MPLSSLVVVVDLTNGRLNQKVKVVQKISVHNSVILKYEHHGMG